MAPHAENSRPGGPEAAAAIWAGARPERAATDFAALARRNRLRGSLQAVGAAALGALLLWLDARVVAGVVFCVAAIVGVSALAAPTSLYAAIERGFAALGRWTGLVLAWVLLAPVFYLFFAPFGRLLRRGRRDRLQRAPEPEAETFWEPHEGMRVASDSYLRQF